MTDTRTLVSEETIASLDPIEGADLIEKATIKGWTVVVKKGEFEVGDLVLYFEIDSALPVEDPRFAFLAERSSRRFNDRWVHVLRTVKLRGVYSQGLVLPYDDFIVDAAFKDHTDLSWQDVLKVEKYEPPLPTNMEAAGGFPAHLGRKTDSERVQNLTEEFDGLEAAGPWVPTEKIDGTSLSVFIDQDGTPRVCSRNWELAPSENLYWRMVRDAGILDILDVGEGLQGEIYGEGVQNNPLGIKGNKIAVFSILRNRTEVPRDEWPEWETDLMHPAPVYALDFPGSVDHALEQVDGIKSLISPQRLAEGVVWHSQTQADGVLALKGRKTFKAISNKFLAKQKD